MFVFLLIYKRIEAEANRIGGSRNLNTVLHHSQGSFLSSGETPTTTDGCVCLSRGTMSEMCGLLLGKLLIEFNLIRD